MAEWLLIPLLVGVWVVLGLLPYYLTGGGQR